MNAYITDIAISLPNDPIENEELEKVLGLVHALPSRTKKIPHSNNAPNKRH